MLFFRSSILNKSISYYLTEHTIALLIALPALFVTYLPKNCVEAVHWLCTCLWSDRRLVDWASRSRHIHSMVIFVSSIVFAWISTAFLSCSIIYRVPFGRLHVQGWNWCTATSLVLLLVADAESIHCIIQFMRNTAFFRFVASSNRTPIFSSLDASACQPKVERRRY